MDLVVEETYNGAITYRRAGRPANEEWTLHVEHTRAIMFCEHNGADRERIYCQCWDELISNRLDDDLWTDAVSRLGSISGNLPLIPKGESTPRAVFTHVLMQRINNNPDLILAAVSEKYAENIEPDFICALRKGEGLMVLTRSVVAEMMGRASTVFNEKTFNCNSEHHTWNTQSHVEFDLASGRRKIIAAHAVCKGIMDKCYYCASTVGSARDVFDDLVPSWR